jgi:hypothetical protein
MKTYVLRFCFTYILYCFLWQNSMAQILPLMPPQNIRCFSLYTSGFSNRFPQSILNIECDPVSGATGYQFDIAEDSTFTRMVSGLQRFIPRFPFNSYCFDVNGNCNSWSTNIFGLLQGKQYYTRVRAFNTLGESLSSTIASSSIRWAPNVYVGKPENRQISVKLQSMTDTTATFNYYHSTQKTVVWITVNGQDTLIRNAQNNLFTIKLEAKTKYKLFIEPEIELFLRTFSSDMVRYGRVISYYEGPNRPEAGQDTTYYQKILDSLESYPGPQQAEELLRELARNKIAIDTAWFNTGGFVRCLSEPTNYCEGPNNQLIAKPALVVKTRSKDSRLEKLGYVTGINLRWSNWQYSETAIYFQFNVGGSVPVITQHEIPSLSLGIAPNPVHNETTIRYTLPVHGQILIEIYNLLGQKISVLKNEYTAAGEYTFPLQTSQFTSGMYLVRYTSETSGGHQLVSARLFIAK